MNRILTSTDLGEGRIRWRVRIESDDCEAGSDMMERMKQVLLQNFADNPSLLLCGLVPFQTLKMIHSGTNWIIEAEAVEQKPR
jgi:hypothetical protein